MRAMHWVWMAAVGCTGGGVELTTPDDTNAEPVDLRREFPAPPEGGLQFLTPDYVIPARSERQFCWFTSYDGPDMAMRGQWTYQSPGGHHVQITSTGASTDTFADDEVVDCTLQSDMPMTNLEPLLVLSDIDPEAEGGPVGGLELPDGFATPLDQGTRIVIQSHYVNTTADDILVNDAVNVALMDTADVTTWTAPYVHIETDLAIAQGDDAQDVDCTWDADYDLLFLGGHMHEWGTAFSVELSRAGGAPESVYDIPQWDPVYRDAPPIDRYEAGAFHVADGDRFVTHCAWNNDTDHVMGFPEEMCAVFGMAYPLKVPIVCDP